MTDKIPVFQAEIDLGIGDLVAASGRLAFAALAVHDDTPITSTALSYVGQAKGTNLNQDDLYYLKAILVSTGINKNDDYFDQMETWKARATPEDKPFNYEHKQDDIIGHITASSAINVDGTVIENDTKDAELPDKFHLLTTAVLYKYCDVEERQKRITKTIAEVDEGKWYVSMEALFKGFDYVIIPKTSTKGEYDLAQAKLVVRGDSTAFLTKHLRAYGGTGEWNGNKVGRVLRKILFHGNGLVKKPANPESLIFNMENEPLSGTAAKISHLPEQLGYSTDGGLTFATQERNEDMANDIELLTAKVADLTKQLDTEKAANWSKQVETLTAEVAAATDKLAKAVEAQAEAEKVKTTLQAQVTDLTSKATAAEAAKVEAETKLNEITKAAKLADRLAKVKAAYNETDDVKAAEILDAIVDLSDEKFAKSIAVAQGQTDYIAKKLAEYTEATKLGESKVSNLPAPMGGKPTPVGSSPTPSPSPSPTDKVNLVKTATAGALDNATVTDNTALAAGGVVEDAFEQTQADVLAYFCPKKDEE